MKRKPFYFLLVVILVFSTSNFVQAETKEIEVVEQELTNAPKKDRIEYRYKIQNEKMYKRLYNYSRKKWIGSWVLCK